MTENSNNTKALDLYDTIVQDWLSDACTFRSEKQRKLAHYLALGVKPRQAALRCGYSRRFANSGVYALLKINKDFRAKIETIKSNFRETYPAFCENMLPEISYVERQIITNLAENPDKIDAVKAKVMRDVKQSAGVLKDGEAPQPTVQVAVQVSVQQALASQLEAKMSEQEGQVVDIEDEEK